jgi:hypothetical protein
MAHLDYYAALHRDEDREAARLTTSVPEQRYLGAQVRRLRMDG